MKELESLKQQLKEANKALLIAEIMIVEYKNFGKIGLNHSPEYWLNKFKKPLERIKE